jgi:hypothetical protein
VSGSIPKALSAPVWKEKKPVNIQTMRRAAVTAELVGYAALIDTAAQRAKALLPNVSEPLRLTNVAGGLRWSF